jgi:hypothetical protein
MTPGSDHPSILASIGLDPESTSPFTFGHLPEAHSDLQASETQSASGRLQRHPSVIRSGQCKRGG